MRILNLATIILIIFISGCSSLKSPNFPALQGYQVSKEESALLLSLLKARAKEVRSIKTLAKVAFKSGSEKSSARYVFALENPKSIHLEVLPLSGGYAIGVLKTDGKKILYLDTAPKIAYQERLKNDSLDKFLMLPLPPDYLLPLLSGRVPQSVVTSKKESLKFYKSRNPGFIILVIGNNREWYEINSETLILNSFAIRDQFKDKDLLAADFALYTSDGSGFHYPKSIQLKLLTVDTLMSISMGTVTINDDLASDLFSQEIPAGFSVEKIK